MTLFPQNVNVLNSPEDVEFSSTDTPLVYEKEHIYEGDFEKDDFKFKITAQTIDHFAKESNRWIENGNMSTLPLEHTDNPEHNRGVNEKFYAKKDTKGRYGLFSRIKFDNEEAAKMAKNTQTSIFSPPRAKDGKGVEYVRPVQHVALTNKPVVPGLDNFTPIAASLVTSVPKKKGNEMPIKDLAVKLGLELADGASEDDAAQAIELSFTEAREATSTLQLSFDDYKKANPVKADPVQVSDAQIEMFQENRELKLSRLVEKGNITPAVKKKIEDAFCGKDNLTLCLSGQATDKFNAVIEALADNDPVVLGEQTGPQSTDVATLKLSDNNPLVADAERRAKGA